MPCLHIGVAVCGVGAAITDPGRQQYSSAGALLRSGPPLPHLLRAKERPLHHTVRPRVEVRPAERWRLAA